MPVVDILMPVFNAGAYLDLAVESIRAQNFSDFRLILVNDGSTDGSGERCRALAARDPRLVCIDQENQGITRSLNRALAQADAPFVARMDADDLAEPGRLTQQLRYLEAHPAVIGLGSSVHSIDSRGAIVNRYDPPALHESIDRELLTGNGGALIHPTLVFRRAALTAVGGYAEDLPFSQDLDLFLRLAEIGRLANLLSPLLRYRLHPGSSNFTQGAKKRELKEGILRRTAARRGRPFVPPPVHPLLHERDPSATCREWALYAAAHRERRAALRHLLHAVAHRPLAWENARAARLILPRLLRRRPSVAPVIRSSQNHDLEVLRLAAEHAPAATSLLAVGPRHNDLLRRFTGIADKTAIDLASASATPGAHGIQGDFLACEPGRRYDLVLCLQVLEHVAEPTAFARKLLATGSTVIASVSCPKAGADARLLAWFGQPPRDWIRVADEDQERIACVYHSAPTAALA